MGEALEARRMFAAAAAEYEHALTSDDPCVVTKAADGAVRALARAKSEELRGQQEQLLVARGLIDDLKFADAKSLIDKVTAHELRLAAATTLAVLHARESEWWTRVILWSRLGLSYLLIAGLVIALILVVRAVSLRHRSARIYPLVDLGGGTTGGSFAEVVEALGFEIRTPVAPGTVSPTLVLVDRGTQLPAVSLKLGALDVSGVSQWILWSAFPTRYSVTGVVLPAGSRVLAEVSLRRTRYLGRQREKARWSFSIPAEEGDVKIMSLRSHGWEVLYHLLKARQSDGRARH
jgi:hypothetical protein